MNSNQLEYFKIIYEKRNLQAAARAIPMSYQGLLKSLATLEAEFEVVLFARLSDGSLCPTAYAEVLKAHIEKIDETLEHLEHEFRKLDRSAQSELKIAAASGSVGILGPRFAESFSEKYPGIRLSWSELPDFDVDKAIRDDQYNLGISATPFDDSLRTIPLHVERRCMWVRQDDPLAQKDVLTVKDLDGYCIGVVGEHFKNHQMLLDSCEQHQVTPEKIEIRNELFWLYCYAKEPNHVAFTVENAQSLLGDDPLIACIPIEGFDWGLGLSYRKNAELQPDEYTFIDFCASYVRSYFDQ